MSERRTARSVALATAFVPALAAAGGADWVEDGDAGALPVAAQQPIGAGPLTRITGRLSGVGLAGDLADYEDVFLVHIDDPDAFSARASATFNTQLWLFDADGYGRVGNDDAPDAKTTGSLLVSLADDGSDPAIVAGDYYLAVSGYDRDPISVSGTIFAQKTGIEISGPDGRGADQPVSEWTSKHDPGTGEYGIDLTGVAFVELHTCDADVTLDGVVDVVDVLEIIIEWGATDSHADVNDDGRVDVQDLVEVMLAFGPCGEEPDTCPGEGDCFAANGTPGCELESCCKLVCVSDPFCCDSGWDDICAETASLACIGQSCPGEGDCFAANGSPGCGSETCCALVCATDPFCCDSEWDGTCAELATRQCFAQHCPGTGDCFVANGTPGCEVEICCENVCADDPSCCEVAWDTSCAASASELCHGADPCPGEGDCYLPNGTGGCENETCCAVVCAVDPYCCNVEWDDLCADTAIAECPASCTVQCPVGALLEPEACGANLNGGCNSTPASFGRIECGQTACGSAWSQNGVRDTDWYMITIDDAGCTRITANLVSEFPGAVYIVGGLDGCNATIIGAGGAASVCKGVEPATATVGPGTYVVFVATAGYDGVPCGASNMYKLDVYCTPAGPGDCDG